MARSNRQRGSAPRRAEAERARVDEDREPVDDRTEEEKEAARGRFSDPIISYMWHPDGTPFSDEEYRERGIEPPPPGEQEELIILD